MADLVYIANAALDRVGQSQIIALTDPTTSARKANLHIYEAIRQVLRAGRWKSATKQATPAQLTNVPLFQWSFAYQLPGDFIRMVSVVSGTIPDPSIPPPDAAFNTGYEIPEYAIQGKTVLTQETVLQINYVADLTMAGNDVNVTDAALTELFILNLAQVLCWPFQQSNALRQSLLQEFTLKMRAARNIDAQDSKDPQPSALADSAWLRERITSTAGS